MWGVIFGWLLAVLQDKSNPFFEIHYLKECYSDYSYTSCVVDLKTLFNILLEILDQRIVLCGYCTVALKFNHE